ncbi:uncharacterized protein [Watersipora subatra]|uniref:uncharacterized protein n=1 Tax=Watersipora subatra TaxID=2589382 RepID=UPI00355BDE68
MSKASFGKGKAATRCGRYGRGPHSREQCPAKDAKCQNCSKRGHFQVRCRSQRVEEVKQYSGTEDSENEDGFLFTGELVIGEINGRKANTEVNTHSCIFKLDTGADRTVISNAEPWIKQIPLSQCSEKLYRPGKKPLEIIGTFQANMEYQGRRHSETAYVLQNQQVSLLIRKAGSNLGLITCNIKGINQVDKEIISEYPGLFKGLGLLKKYTYEISLKPDIKPVHIFTPRSIPHPLTKAYYPTKAFGRREDLRRSNKTKQHSETRSSSNGYCKRQS